MEKQITDASFDAEVLKAKQPVLIDFWAPWCGPCRTVEPMVDELAKELEGKAIVGKVNVDENNKYAGQYGVMSIPTFLIFKNGEVVDQITGVTNKEELKERVEKHI
jgi:thioredoxin 1